ncbi:MAG: GNAT family N-acetyltransferase [Patescibacteria group bacterium]
MRTTPLDTSKPGVKLVEPDVERDADVSMHWLVGDLGVATLLAMGVPAKNISEPHIDNEVQRIKDFIANPDQLNWTILYEENPVGAVWVDLRPVDTVHAPAIHIMIGDLEVRGKGVGQASISAVAKHLQSLGHNIIYSRHLISNSGAAKLLQRIGFRNDGETYTDKDSLEWQNVKLLFK